MERVLKVDPEFQNKIPPLTDDEFKQLEENIMDAGEVYEPITVWNDTIIDGHNRYKIILMHPGIRWRVREAKFADKWEAFDWMYRNQLGRRNLTDEQRHYLLGKMYEARKHVHGFQEETQSRDADGTFRRRKNCDTGKGRTSEQIAKERGIGSRTVESAGCYAKGIDAIRAEEPELADSILKAERKLSKKEVEAVGKAHPVAQKAMIESIRTGEAEKKSHAKGDTKRINKIVEDMSGDTCMEYTIRHMTEQIRMNSEAFIRSLSNLIMDHPDITNEHRYEIVRAIDENITNRIMQIKEILNNGTQL